MPPPQRRTGQRNTKDRPSSRAAAEQPAAVGAISAHPRGAVLAVVVTPRSGVTAFDRLERDAVRVRVAAPPVAGAANDALLRFLADAAGIRPSAVRLVAGTSARRKRILFADLTPTELTKRLALRHTDLAPPRTS